MGDKPTLCDRCTAAAARSSGSVGIGAIRPALKVVRLKPGEAPPPEYLAQQQMREQKAAEQNVQEPAPFSGTYRAASPEPPSPEQPQYAPTARRRSSSIFGALLIIFSAWALVWIIRGPGAALFHKPEPEPLEPENNLPRIVIHEHKEVVVDGEHIVGKFSLEDDVYALNRVQAFFTPSKNLLQLAYYGEQVEGGKDAKPDPNQELVRVSLQFGPLAGRLDREKLQSYMVELLVKKEPLRFVKSYSKQLAAFGEVTPLSGALKDGETIRGVLQDTRTYEREGSNLRASWELHFETPVKVDR